MLTLSPINKACLIRFVSVASSAPKFGECREYQVPYTNPRGRYEVEPDVVEGTNMVMIKPAMLYLELMAKRSFSILVAAYAVFGEYTKDRLCTRLDRLLQSRLGDALIDKTG